MKAYKCGANHTSFVQPTTHRIDWNPTKQKNNKDDSFWQVTPNDISPVHTNLDTDVNINCKNVIYANKTNARRGIGIRSYR